MRILTVWDNANQYLVDKIILILGVKEKRTSKQLELIRYSLACIVSEIEKLVLLVLIFTAQGYIGKFLIEFITIVSLRIFMGGSHRETNLGCFIQSFLTFEIIIYLDGIITLTKLDNYAIWILTTVWIWKCAPILSVKRARYSDVQCMKFKVLAMMVLFFQTMMVGIAPRYIANVMSWSIALQLAEVGIISLKLRKEERKNV